MQTEKYQRPILLFHLCARRSSRQVIALCKVNRELPRGECQAQCRLSFFPLWRGPGSRAYLKFWYVSILFCFFLSLPLSLSLFLPFFPLPFCSRVLTMFRPWLEARQRRFYRRFSNWRERVRGVGENAREWILDQFLPALFEAAVEKYRCSCSRVNKLSILIEYCQELKFLS